MDKQQVEFIHDVLCKVRDATRWNEQRNLYTDVQGDWEFSEEEYISK